MLRSVVPSASFSVSSSRDKKLQLAVCDDPDLDPEPGILSPCLPVVCLIFCKSWDVIKNNHQMAGRRLVSASATIHCDRIFIDQLMSCLLCVIYELHLYFYLLWTIVYLLFLVLSWSVYCVLTGIKWSGIVHCVPKLGESLQNLSLGAVTSHWWLSYFKSMYSMPQYMQFQYVHILQLQNAWVHLECHNST